MTDDQDIPPVSFPDRRDFEPVRIERRSPVPPDPFPAGQSSLFTLDGILYIVFRRKWLILLGFVAGIAAAATLYVVTPRVFESDAKLLVRYVSDSTSLDPTVQNERVLSPDTRGGNILNSEIEIMTSQDLLEDVAESVGIERLLEGRKDLPPSPGLATILLRQNLSVDVPRNSNIIRLGFRSKDPQLAQQVLDELVNRYLDKHQKVHGAAGAYEYFSQQTDQLRSTLATTEEELQRLKNEQGVVSIEDSKQKLADRLASLNDRSQQETVDRAATAARLDLIQEQLGMAGATADEPGSAETFDNGDEVANIREQLSQLYTRETELLQSYTRDSTPVRALRVQIREAEAQLSGRASPAMLTNLRDDSDVTLHKELILERAELASAEARLRIMGEQITVAQEEIRELNGSESRIVQLERKKELQEANYRYFSESLERARIDTTLAPGQMSNINVVQPATLPILSTRDELRKRMAIALIGGIGLGAGLALLLEILAGRSLRRPVEVERMLEIPSLMTFPRAPAFRQLFALNGHAPKKLLPAGGGAGGDVSPPAERMLSASVDRYFEALVHRIEQTGVLSGSVPHLIGVTGCVPGSGTTTVATGLAVTMSEREDQKILLVEAGLGKGVAHRILGVTPDSTLMDVLTGGTGRSVKVQDRLYLLSAGNGDQPTPHMSLGRRFRELVSFLKESKHTTVIVDLPPITETSPTLQIASLLDGIIVVLEPEKVSQQNARRALELLQRSDANVLGAVLNKKRDYVPSWLDENA